MTRKSQVLRTTSCSVKRENILYMKFNRFLLNYQLYARRVGNNTNESEYRDVLFIVYSGI